MNNSDLFALGREHERAGDVNSAVTWYQQAAERGHQGARARLDVVRRGGRAARDGHATNGAAHAAAGSAAGPAAAGPANAGLRPVRHVKAFVTTDPPANRAEAIDAWERLRQRVPDDEKPVPYLANATGLAARQVAHLQEVRHFSAHSKRFGWPSQADVNRALETARAIERRLDRPRRPVT